MKDIESIKYNFDLVISELDLFYPIINSMFCENYENRNLNLFADSVKEFNQNMILHSLNRVSLENVLSDSKLYLDENILERFYLVGINEIQVKKNHLNNIIKAVIKPISQEDSYKLESIFFENFNQGYSFVPKISIEKNNSFPDELIKGIIKYFNDFESAFSQIQPTNKTNYKNQLTGFICNLHPDTVKEIFNLMETSKQISGNLTDFQAIFANTSTPVKSPVKWLIKSQKKPYRGHQTKLYLFIETMLNGKFSAEDKRKAADLFIDEKGKFFNPKMKEPNENDRDTHNIFEARINNIKEKTRPA